MLLKIKRINYTEKEEYVREEDWEVLFECNHVEDTFESTRVEDVTFSDYHIIIVRNSNSYYGFSILWDNGDGTYSFDGLGNTGAVSIICALLQERLK